MEVACAAAVPAQRPHAGRRRGDCACDVSPPPTAMAGVTPPGNGNCHASAASTVSVERLTPSMASFTPAVSGAWLSAPTACAQISRSVSTTASSGTSSPSKPMISAEMRRPSASVSPTSDGAAQLSAGGQP